MSFCEKCGAQLSDSAAFCGQCGAKVIQQPAKKICPGCGAEAPADMVFCDRCGTRLVKPSCEEKNSAIDDSLPVSSPTAQPWKSTMLWCCLGVGVLSYLIQAFLYRPQNIWQRTNFLLVLLFAFQTPCFLLAITGLLNRWFQKRGWTMKRKFRRGLLLTIACAGSIWTYYIALWGGRVSYARLIGPPESAGTTTAFLTLHFIGIIFASLALALGNRNGKLGWADFRAVIAVVTFFSLIAYLYMYPYLPLWKIGIPSNFYIAPYQLTTTFVVGWKLFRENLPLIRVHSVLPKISLITIIVSAITLIGGINEITGFAMGRFLFDLYMLYRFYDPILLLLGLLFMIIAAILWFFGSQKFIQTE